MDETRKFCVTGRQLAYAWLFLMAFCQTVTNYPIGMVANTGLSLQWHHVVGGVGLLALLTRKKIVIPINLFSLIYLYAILLSAAFAPKFGFGTMAVNMVYAVAIYIITYNCAQYFTLEKLCRIMCLAGMLYALLVAVNTAVNIQAVIACIQGKSGHPIMKTIVGGGPNLEATYVAFFSVFFLERRKYWYWLFALLISASYASRTGMLICLLAFMLHIFSRVDKLTARRVIVGAGAVLAVLLLGVALFLSGVFDAVIGRYLKIGEEVGSVARLRLWATVPSILKDYPFGCGYGNAIEQAQIHAGIAFRENNLHNVYMQYLVELGPIGLILFLSVLARVGYTAFKARFRNVICDLLLLFFASYLFQSRGTEPLFFMMMAFFYAWRGGQLKEEKTESL